MLSFNDGAYSLLSLAQARGFNVDKHGRTILAQKDCKRVVASSLRKAKASQKRRKAESRYKASEEERFALQEGMQYGPALESDSVAGIEIG